MNFLCVQKPTFPTKTKRKQTTKCSRRKKVPHPCLACVSQRRAHRVENCATKPVEKTGRTFKSNCSRGSSPARKQPLRTHDTRRGFAPRKARGENESKRCCVGPFGFSRIFLAYIIWIAAICTSRNVNICTTLVIWSFGEITFRKSR